MAKITEASLVPDATPGRKNGFVVRRTRQGPVAAAWPPKAGKWNTPGDFYRQQEFGLVARMVSNPNPLDLMSAINVSKDSDQVPRDLLMMAAYGTLYDLTFLDGTPIEKYRMVAPNAQLILDQVTDTPGALMYRSPLGWVEIPPGNNSDVLRMNAGVPGWDDGGGGGGGTTYSPMLGMLAFGSSSTVLHNTVTGTAGILVAGQVVNGIQIWSNTAVPTCQIAGHIYGKDASALPGALLVEGPQQTGIVQGVNTALFTTPFVIPATDAYWFGLQIATASIQQPLSNGVLYGYAKTHGYPAPDPLGTNTQSFGNTLLKCWPV